MTRRDQWRWAEKVAEYLRRQLEDAQAEADRNTQWCHDPHDNDKQERWFKADEKRRVLQELLDGLDGFLNGTRE
jgi:hypothetical protein